MNQGEKILNLVIPFDEIDKIDDLGALLRRLADEFDSFDKSSRMKEFTPSIGYIKQVKEIDIIYKKCNNCGKLYEATSENFYKYNKFPGLAPICKKCID